MKPLLLDAFCGAGGCSVGYNQAGFEVVGVDIAPMPRYPFPFVQMDALESLRILIAGGCITDNTGQRWYLSDFAAISASPPCQFYSVTASLSNGNHPDLVGPVRDLLLETGLAYVIENVEGAPLVNPITLCGSMFPGLRVYRHRLFETNPPIYWPPAPCNHSYKMPPSKGAYHKLKNREFITCVGHNFQAESGRVAMKIDWMTRDEMAQAIPPAYCEWIGKQLLEAMEATQ
jgi:DNA (cytosine-5)-methyltransferase 1